MSSSSPTSPPPELRVARIRKPETIAHPAIKALIQLAIEKTRYPGSEPQALYDELSERVHEEALAVYVGLEDKRPRSVVIVMLPLSRAMMYPQVLILYNEGRPELRHKMGKVVRAFVTKHGFDRILGVNLNYPDAVMMRGFADMGRANVLGSLMEFVF